MYIDSHCHLDKLTDSEAAIRRAKAAQVNKMICISVDLDVWPAMMSLVDAHDGVFASVGVHPGYQDIRDPELNELIELSQHPKVVAIGETGLDYAKKDTDYEWQRERFKTHIRAAKATGKPLVIHTRNAVDDTIRLLAEEEANTINSNDFDMAAGVDTGMGNGVIHCFTESTESAHTFIDMGFYISISGIVTFNSAKALQETVKALPLDRLLIETDAPWLAPVPNRGKENEPSFVTHTAAHIAKLKNIDVEEVIATTTANATQCFGLPA